MAIQNMISTIATQKIISPTPDATSLRAFVNIKIPVPAVDAVRAMARALEDMSSICFIFEVSMPRSMAVDCFIFLRGDGVGLGSLGVRQPFVAAASSTARADGTESKAGARDLRAASCRAYRRRRSEYHKRCKFCNDSRGFRGLLWYESWRRPLSVGLDVVGRSCRIMASVASVYMS